MVTTSWNTPALLRAALPLLLLACSSMADTKLNTHDYFRATQSKPRASLTGSDFQSMASSLNQHLTSMPGLQTKPCEEFSTGALKSIVRTLMSSRQNELQHLYKANNDRRALGHDSIDALEAHWVEQQATLDAHPDLKEMARAAKCHQAVMLLVHHLAEATKQELLGLISMPLLPIEQHSTPNTATATEARHSAVQAVHGDYVQESGCAAGHIIGKGNSTFNPGCIGTEECPVWPAQFSAPFGLYAHLPPITNASSMFYYKVTDGVKKQLVDYQTYCFPFVNIFHYKQPCKLYFQPEGIFLHQPGHVNCCQFKANVSAVPIQFLHSFTLKERNVMAPDFYGNQVSTDHWVGPLNFQYWTVGHNDTRYHNYGHDIVFQDGPTGVTWQWGNFDTSPQDDSVFELPGTPEECAQSCPTF